MPLEEFTHVRAKVRDREPRLGVQRNGRVSLNLGAMRALGNPKHVVFLFDPEAMILGVRPASAEEPHSYGVKGDPVRAGGNNISASALWAFYEIDCTDYLGSYLARQEGNRLLITLKRTPAKADGRRAD